MVWGLGEMLQGTPLAHLCSEVSREPESGGGRSADSAEHFGMQLAEVSLWEVSSGWGSELNSPGWEAAARSVTCLASGSALGGRWWAGFPVWIACHSRASSESISWVPAV